METDSCEPRRGRGSRAGRRNTWGPLRARRAGGRAAGPCCGASAARAGLLFPRLPFHADNAYQLCKLQPYRGVWAASLKRFEAPPGARAQDSKRRQE